MTDTTVVSLQDIRDAAHRMAGAVHHTPVIRSRTLDALLGSRVYLKAENLQRIGAFKFRGAYNAIAQLSPAELSRGIAAYSSGNHAQAVALAAAELGSTAVILMPADTPAVKLDAVAGYGAEIVTYDRYTEDRVQIGAALAADRGLTLIPPYEHPHVIAGQGTAALELLDEVGDLDALVVPVGGGGLIAGSGIAAKGLQPGIRLVGVEPEAGDDTRRSLAAGERVSIPVPRTIADGQAAATPGELTFSINRHLIDDIVLVSDDEIRDALRFAADRLKLVLEPSGATGLAALLAGRLTPAPARIGVILSGGNVGAARLGELLA
ncbi:pyridoxal-phosphate dependent enzyme [Paractinoplanes durhamensis]|uniref:Serine/threonine dehydratase n=1 Tax=Paractinoplanes durhamensis TaxID=113563 RepID=A0ABQ3YQS4_9ACTN|nr:pyridoxal-phosphate dependent enzyme [Actinoplanes durhamensis]GID99921.1 serine/threonine dehydratase [Actinoplanes durhamensis]